MHVQSQRELRNVFGQIIDSLDVGGDGDPCRHMTENEAFMYREMLRMGFPPMVWFLEASGRIDDGSLPVLYPNVKTKDAGYFKDFWTVDGYLGADPNSAGKQRVPLRGRTDLLGRGCHETLRRTANRGIDGKNTRYGRDSKR